MNLPRIPSFDAPMLPNTSLGEYGLEKEKELNGIYMLVDTLLRGWLIIKNMYGDEGE